MERLNRPEDIGKWKQNQQHNGMILGLFLWIWIVVAGILIFIR
jgi:hypothetical protein